MDKLTLEQEARLREIISLPEEEQKKELEEFLKELTPEQVESLRSAQSTSKCPFCLISEEKIPSMKVYEDNQLLGILDINPANKGHTILFPKQHYQDMAQMSDSEVAYLFSTANKLMHIISDAVDAKGSNIFLADGIVAGQNSPHILLHLIPRFENDNIDFNWKSAKLTEGEMNEIKNLIIEKGNQMFSRKPEAKESEEEVDYTEEERIP